MDVNGLPDDVIAKIFSLLPPLMLVDSVPLVCKRWHQLSKHPDSWRNFNAIIPSDASKEELEELSRFAKAAPYMNCLDVSNIVELNPQVSLVINAFLKEHKTVKILCTMETSTKRMRAFTKNMLEKFASTLREVYIPFVCPINVTEEFHASANNLLTLVSEIPNLQCLGFKRIDVEEFKNYRGQLGKGCPSLKKFVLQSSIRAEREMSRLVLDVLESKKDVLKEIDFEIVCEPVEKFMAAVRGCHNVEILKVPVGILPVIANMSQLRSLGLFFTWFLDSFLIVPPSDLQKFIEESPVIGKITELSLSCSQHGHMLPQYNITVNQCLEALAKRSKGIQVFRIYNLHAKEHLLNLFFSSMKCVHTIILHKCSESSLGHHITVDSTKMKFLKIKEFRVYSQSEQEKFEDTVRKLQLSQPQLVVEFDCKIMGNSNTSDESGSEFDLNFDGTDSDYDCYGDYEFTYFDYLRNKYGEDLSDSELYAFMSSDED